MTLSFPLSSTLGFPLLAPMGGNATSENFYLATNANVFPYQTTASSSNVRQNFKNRLVAGSPTVSFTRLRFTYVNFIPVNGGETNGGFEFDVRMGVRDADGVWYPGYCNGLRDATVPIGGAVHFDVDMPCNGGDWILECCRVIGPSGSQNYLTSHGTTAYRNDGIFVGTDSSIDMTTGGTGTNSVGFGATCTPVLSANTVNSVTITNGGDLYGTSPTIQFLAQDATAGGANYSTTRTGQVVTGGFKNSGGTNFTEVPLNNIVGGGYTANDSVIYAAAIVSGVSADPVVSLMLIGDSRTRGFGSTDGLGNLLNGNYGVPERCFNSLYGTLNLGILSNTATAYISAHTKAWAAIVGNGVVINNTLIYLGVNDITGAGRTYAQVAADLETIKGQVIDTFNSQVLFSTNEPAVDAGGTYTGDPTVGQTPRTGAGDGGYLTELNEAVRDGTIAGTSSGVYFDPAVVVSDETQPFYWKYDLGFPLTGDGIHDSGWTTATAKSGTTYNLLTTTRGLDYMEANITVPTLYPTAGGDVPDNAYVAEDGTTYYVAEDGTTYYVQES